MGEVFLKVNVAKQILELYQRDSFQQSYPISTSKFGLGSEPNSLKTPLGWHVIAKKIGEGLPPGAVLRSREWTGAIWSFEDPYQTDEDLVLSRILWLEGVEPSNRTSFERYIYIHGTNQENEISAPASHGCVRMRNQDIIELFDKIPEGTKVNVVES
ncbi:MAG: L,D-transpeptidase [Verrucomicrobiia bacterium]